MEAKSLTTQPSNSIPLSQRGVETRSTYDLAFLIVINVTLLSAIAAVIYVYISKRRQHLLLSVKSHPTAPCLRCQYFNNNPYLKCALHPVTVLTKEASDCKNYSLYIEKKRFEK